MLYMMSGGIVDVTQSVGVGLDASGSLKVKLKHGAYPSFTMEAWGAPEFRYDYQEQSFNLSIANNINQMHDAMGELHQARVSDPMNARYREKNSSRIEFLGFSSGRHPKGYSKLIWE